jgi:nucleoside diphosphate kinase
MSERAESLEHLLAATTVLDHKAALFGQESFAREAYRDLEPLAGEQTLELALAHATTIVKPETIVVRGIDAFVDRIGRAGFTPIVVRTVSLDRQTIRTLWWYVLNAATLDRIDLLDLFKPATESLLLVLRDDAPIDGVPAAVRYQQLKGPTHPPQRGPEDLRSHLGPPNRLLNFVHAADEPADVIRELGLLFERAERREVIREMLAGRPAWDRLEAEKLRLYQTYPAQDLLLEPAVARLAAAIRERVPEPAATTAASLVESIPALDADAAEHAWHEAADLLWPYAHELGVWDYVVVGSHVCDHDVAGSTRVIPDPAVGSWNELWMDRARDRSLTP